MKRNMLLDSEVYPLFFQDVIHGDVHEVVCEENLDLPELNESAR